MAGERSSRPSKSSILPKQQWRLRIAKMRMRGVAEVGMKNEQADKHRSNQTERTGGGGERYIVLCAHERPCAATENACEKILL